MNYKFSVFEEPVTFPEKESAFLEIDGAFSSSDFDSVAWERDFTFETTMNGIYNEICTENSTPEAQSAISETIITLPSSIFDSLALERRIVFETSEIRNQTEVYLKNSRVWHIDLMFGTGEAFSCIVEGAKFSVACECSIVTGVSLSLQLPANVPPQFACNMLSARGIRAKMLPKSPLYPHRLEITAEFSALKTAFRQNLPDEVSDISGFFEKDVSIRNLVEGLLSLPDSDATAAELILRMAAGTLRNSAKQFLYDTWNDANFALVGILKALQSGTDDRIFNLANASFEPLLETEIQSVQPEIEKFGERGVHSCDTLSVKWLGYPRRFSARGTRSLTRWKGGDDWSTATDAKFVLEYVMRSVLCDLIDQAHTLHIRRIQKVDYQSRQEVQSFVPMMLCSSKSGPAAREELLKASFQDAVNMSKPIVSLTFLFFCFGLLISATAMSLFEPMPFDPLITIGLFSFVFFLLSISVFTNSKYILLRANKKFKRAYDRAFPAHERSWLSTPLRNRRI